MNIVEVKSSLAGETCWYWEISFTDKFGCDRKLQSPVRFNPGIPDYIQTALETRFHDLTAPPHYTLT